MKTRFYLSKLLASANLIFFLLLSINGYSQTPSYYNFNGGTAYNVFPLGGGTNKVQWVYGPGKFNSAGATGIPSGSGTITKIYIRLGTTVNAAYAYPDYTVSLAQNIGTATTHAGTTFLTGLTQCFYQSSFAMTGALPTSWYAITLTPFVYDATKSLVVELKNNGTGTTQVAQASGTGSERLWATYAATTGSAGAGLLDFGIDLSKGSNDAGIYNIITPLCTPTLVATYMNGGINNIDSVKINWSVNGSLQNQNRYNKVTLPGGSVNITLTPEYSFIDGNTYNVKSWTSLPNNKKDTLNKNDTFKITFKYQGPAGSPTVKDVIKCGPGQAPLQATPLNMGDSIVWYSLATGGSTVAKGKNTLSPPLVLGVNTFYAAAFKMSGPLKLANALAGTTTVSSGTYQGAFVNITPQTDVALDSFVTRASTTTPGLYNVYFKVNTFAGFETNAAAWTLLASGVTARVALVGGKNLQYIKIPETVLNKGVTYGFYIVNSNSVLHYCTALAGGFTMSNSEITVFQSGIMYGTAPFMTLNVSYYTDLEVHYRMQSCPSARIPIKVTVKPSPNGADFQKSTPFQSPVAATTNGTLGNPDIVALGDQLTYELLPPKGYTTSNHGTDWKTFTPVVKTKKGIIVPMGTSWNYTPPIGSTPGRLTFTPAAALIDEFLILSMRIEDIKLYQCDSTVLKHVFVAPRPKPDFKFGQPVCDGDAVIFTNVSSVSSGNLINKWDFGTGDPADTATNTDVVFTFPTHGTYNVTLVTTTVPYGYTETKTIPVVVTEIPKIGFKVFNACLGDSIRFANTTTISLGAIVYNWDFGNGTSSTKINPKQKYPLAGGYKVSLTATSNGCSQTLTKNAQQFARPVAKFTLPKVLCDKTDIIFTNASTIPIGNMGYTWNFGDGAVSGFASPAHNYSTPGPKSVKMKVVSEFGCADSLTQSFVLAEAPLASFTTGPVCNLSPTLFNFTGTKPGGGFLTTFLWDFDGESSTSVENPGKLFDVTGKKRITLTLTSNNSCSDKISKEIDVKLQSKANFDISDVCEDEDAAFINNSSVAAGNLIYNWKFGDGTLSSTQAPRHLYNIGGISQTFNVTLVAIVPGGCSDSIIKPVTVNAKPKSDFSFAPSGRLINFNATQPGNTTYQWDFSDGGKASSPSAQYHYLNYPTGKYNVCLSVFNAAGCFSQTCKEVAITGSVGKISKLTGIKVFPNPSTGNFTVTIEDPKLDISIAVYNLVGDMVKTIETNPFKSVYSVDLNAANGIYLLKVTNGGLISTQKITINK